MSTVQDDKTNSLKKTTFNLETVPFSEKRDLAFTMTVAMRDTVKLAKKKGSTPTYENCIRLFHDFSPELYDSITNILTQRNISDDAKLYITRAQIKSKEYGKTIAPLEELQFDIDQHRNLLKQTEDDDVGNKKLLRNKIGSLESLKKSLVPRRLSENRILIRDTSRANREDFGAKMIDENDFFVDYELGNDKYLRIRLLHPDNPEKITGADLIYEQHNEKDGKIRFAFLQYKIWDDGVFYFSSAENFEKQYEKMQNCLCKNSKHNFCKGPAKVDEDLEFRFPYCSAFFRPTDRLQEDNEKLVSSGIHIPICALTKLKLIYGGKLERKYMRYSTITQEVFEYLFNRGFVGSRWMDESEVEDFYKESKILESDQSVTFYVREIQQNIKNQ